MIKWLKQWRKSRASLATVLPMNRRNLDYVYPHNARCHFPIANDKLRCKEILAPLGVPLATTHFSYRYFFELDTLQSDLDSLNDFVIKPASGSAGHGILVIVGKEGDEWLGINGRRYSLEALRRHISDIIFGVYSFDTQDVAMIEQRVVQHPAINRLFDRGLADIRIILFQHEPVLAMCRVPTLESDGKANLHQGAIGIGIDLKSGLTTHAMLKGESVVVHPDSRVSLIGVEMPCWELLMAHSRRVAESVPLKYLGVDIAMGEHGPVLLEINARPGLEIQNINHRGMRAVLETIVG